VDIASETDFDESKPLQTQTLTEGMQPILKAKLN
jgi:hypothetical protein